MPNSILFASGKGGVGKTTAVANLGIILSKLGKKVAVVDVDLPTPNLSIHLGIPQDIPTLNDVVRGKAQLDDVIYSYHNGLKVVPAGMLVEHLQGFNPRVFRETMRQIGQNFEVSFFDCAPGLSQEVINAFYGADMMIVVTNPENPAVSDCAKTVEIARDLGVDVKGIVLNRVGRFKNELTSAEVSSRVFDLPIVGKIPEDPYVAEAIAEHSPVVISHPLSPAARAFKKLAHTLLGKDYKEKLSLGDRLKILLKQY